MANPAPTVYVWAYTLLKVAETEHNPKLKRFALKLLDCLHLTIERDHKITRDLALNRSKDIPMGMSSFVSTDDLISHVQMLLHSS